MSHTYVSSCYFFCPCTEEGFIKNWDISLRFRVSWVIQRNCTLRVRASQKIAGLRSTCPQTEVDDHSICLEMMCVNHSLSMGKGIIRLSSRICK